MAFAGLRAARSRSYRRLAPLSKLRPAVGRGLERKRRGGGFARRFIYSQPSLEGVGL